MTTSTCRASAKSPRGRERRAGLGGLVVLVFLALPQTACQEYQCDPPGKSESCACPGGGEGLQVCGPDHAWGDCVECPGTVPVIGFATGVWQDCAWLADGTVKCGGYERPYTPVSGITSAVSVSIGGRFSCALLADGTVKCWGSNEYGGLGNGQRYCEGPDMGDSAEPVAVTGLVAVEKLGSSRDSFSCALHSGKVACWGLALLCDYGCLGVGDMPEDCWCSEAPVDATGIDDAVDLAVGIDRTCARHTDGTWSCWGLGVGSAPVPVPELTDAVFLAVGLDHDCAVLEDGSAACRGINDRGQLGNGTTTDSSDLVPVTGLSDVVDLAVDLRRSCAVEASGRVLCWGQHGCGEVADDHRCDQLVPYELPGLRTATRVTLVGGGPCAVSAGGSVACSSCQGGICVLVPFEL
jgi:hypothetical protein